MIATCTIYKKDFNYEYDTKEFDYKYKLITYKNSSKVDVEFYLDNRYLKDTYLKRFNNLNDALMFTKCGIDAIKQQFDIAKIEYKGSENSFINGKNILE